MTELETANKRCDALEAELAPAAEVAKLQGQRMVLCSLLGECLPVIDALMQIPGDDDSDARLNGLAGRIIGALDAIAEDQVKGVSRDPPIRHSPLRRPNHPPPAGQHRQRAHHQQRRPQRVRALPQTRARPPRSPDAHGAARIRGRKVPHED